MFKSVFFNTFQNVTFPFYLSLNPSPRGEGLTSALSLKISFILATPSPKWWKVGMGVKIQNTP